MDQATLKQQAIQKAEEEWISSRNVQFLFTQSVLEFNQDSWQIYAVHYLSERFRPLIFALIFLVVVTLAFYQKNFPLLCVGLLLFILLVFEIYAHTLPGFRRSIKKATAKRQQKQQHAEDYRVPCQVVLTDDVIQLRTEQPRRVFSTDAYKKLKVLETEDFFFLTPKYNGYVVKKKNLTVGAEADLRTFFAGKKIKMKYLAINRPELQQCIREAQQEER